MLPTLLTTVDKANYSTYLQEKIDRVLNMLKDTLNCDEVKSGFNELNNITPEVQASTPENYRMRCEFSIFHNENNIDFVMYEPGSKPRKAIIIESFPSATKEINGVMPLLKEHVPSFSEIKKKLFEIDFLCNQKGDLVIVFNYHRKLNEQWEMEARELQSLLNKQGYSVSLVAHAKKQKLVVGNDFVIETITTSRGDIQLKQVEGTFSQPNAIACKAMLDFAISCSQNNEHSDLIELYCGSGTFTVALAPMFNKVFATEISRIPTETALFNMKLNNIENIKLVRLSAVEVAQALNSEREFRRLKEKDIDLNTYNFKTLLIDPPRAGLQDEAALKFTARFDRVIYISCGPESLANDLKYLTKTHKITKLAFFDQFPYTNHLESGVLLERR